MNSTIDMSGRPEYEQDRRTLGPDVFVQLIYGPTWLVMDDDRLIKRTVAVNSKEFANFREFSDMVQANFEHRYCLYDVHSKDDRIIVRYGVVYDWNTNLLEA